MTLLGQVAETSRYERTVYRFVAADADAYAGRELTDEELERLSDALGNSTIGDVLSEVTHAVAGITDDDDEDDPDEPDHSMIKEDLRNAR